MGIVLSPYELFYIREMLAADSMDAEYKEVSAILATKFDNAHTEWYTTAAWVDQDLFMAFMKSNHYYETDHYRFDYSVPEELVEVYDKVKGRYFRTRSQKDFEEELFEFFNKQQLGTTELHFCENCGKPIESGLVNSATGDYTSYCCDDCFPFYMMDEYVGADNWRTNPSFTLEDNPDGEPEFEVRMNIGGDTGWHPSSWYHANWSNSKLD